MHVVEYKITLEIDDDKMFDSYADEWVNNNAYARYRIVDEELIRDYWMQEEKIHIEDTLEKETELEEVTVYRGLGELFYFCDVENKVRLVFDADTQDVLYVRGVKLQDVLRWTKSYS